jgi:hypothetical protein
MVNPRGLLLSLVTEGLSQSEKRASPEVIREARASRSSLLAKRESEKRITSGEARSRSERETKGDLRYRHMSMLPTLFHVTNQRFVLRLSLIKQRPCVVKPRESNAKAAEGFGEQYSTSLFYRTGL